MFLLGVFFMARFEEEVLERVSFQQDVPRFMGMLSLRDRLIVLGLFDGKSQTELAGMFEVKRQAIQKLVAREECAIMVAAVKVFGKEAVKGRTKKHRKEQE